MINKKQIIPAVALMAMSGMASAEFSGTVTIVSDYVFRGISQTDGDPAVQGSLDYAHESGFYAGIWGSNVNFGAGDPAHLELDPYVGFDGALANGTAYGVSALYYSYPGVSSNLNYDYWEFAGYLSQGFAGADWTVGANYSPEYFGEVGSSLYYYLSAATALPQGFSVEAHVGRQTFDDNAQAGDDWTDWGVGISKELAGFTMGVGYTDTDIDNCDTCDSRVVVSVQRSL